MSFDPISAILDIGGKLIDRLWPDPTAAAAAKLELMKLQLNGQLAEIAAEGEIAKAQIIVNQAEASNQSMFISGWRPFIGWVCGSAFAYHYLLQPFIVFLCTASGHPIPVMPSFEMGALNEVLYGMLGLGALRTIEKTDAVGKFAAVISAKKK